MYKNEGKMFKNKVLTETTGFVTLICVGTLALPTNLKAYYLPPVSFSEMYRLAQSGDVEALRASVRRGLNIDTINQNGDTGLCIAARRRDTYTYNAFRAAGANPHHPCVQRIDYYNDFLISSKAVPITATPREAYGAIGKETYKISSTTWWILGGLAVGGGIAALAMGGGGGGGSSSSEKSSESGIGNVIGSSGSTLKTTSGLATNSSELSVGNSNLSEVAGINFNKDVISAAKSLNIALKAENGGQYINTADTTINIGAGGAGLVAVNNSKVINNGYLKSTETDFNASAGMMASNNSEAINNGKGIIDGTGANGIDLKFSGYNENNLIIGMYADTSSKITNNGDIKGSATQAISDPTAENKNNSENSSSSGSTTAVTTSGNGTIVGMETMIINANKDSSGNTIYAINGENGNISLSAGEGISSGTDVKLNIIGMSSFLDDSFLNGSKNIQRAEKSFLENNGNITLSYTGSYSAAAENTLRKGLGGIVGIRADANTTGVNNGNINIKLTDTTSSAANSVDVAAAMQSVHSGNITNKNNIKITTSSTNARITYGMMAVEGDGSVSGLYTENKQTLDNIGTIIMNASNSYAMSSFNGGTVVNNGTITIGNQNDSNFGKNTAMYGSGDSFLTTLKNNGTINVYSQNSYAMRNDFSGGNVISNDGIIFISNSAKGSNVFGGNYSKIINNGTIQYKPAASNTSGSSGSSGSSTTGGTVGDNLNLTINQHVMDTKSPTVSSVTSSGNEQALNNGTIITETSNTSAMSVETSQGSAINNNIITVAANNLKDNGVNAGMYLSADTEKSAKIVNNGQININTSYSVGMGSASSYNSRIENAENGVINLNADKTIGLYASGNSNLFNNGTINVNSDDSIAIFSAGTGTGQNSAHISNSIINVKGKNAIIYQINGSAELNQNGRINIDDSVKSTATYYYVNGSLTLKNIDLGIDSGNFVKMGSQGNGTLTIDETTSLSISKQGTIINAENGATSITNKGTLSLPSGSRSYVMLLDKSAKAENYGTINVNGETNYGVYIKSGEFSNKSISTGSEQPTINVKGNKNYGIFAINDAKITNEGNINVSGNDNYGLFSQSSEDITNSGTITLTGSNNYGIYSVAEGKIINSGYINVQGSGNIGIYTSQANVENNGTISVSSGSTGIKAEKAGLVKNNGVINGSGTDIDQPSDETSQASLAAKNFLQVKTKGIIKNNGLITAQSFNFDDSNDGSGQIVVGKNGTYKAQSLSGTVVADADISQNGFNTVYRNDNSFIGKDNGLNIISGSYLFNAQKVQNSNGNTDVVMTMKSFNDVIDNQEFADYLTENYQARKGEETFNLLKGATTAQSFTTIKNREFGFSMLPNLAKQDLDILNNVNRAINDDVLVSTTENSRAKVNVLTYQQKIGNKQEVSGYKDMVKAVYGFNDYQTADKWRVGFGAAAARSDTKFNDNSKRYNNMLEIFAPLTYVNDNFRAMTKPLIGFGKGHYRRFGGSNIYKADLTNYYYGINTEARKTYDLDAAQLEPTIGFNVTNMRIDGIKESNNGLKTDDDNVLSAQSVIGLDIKKDFELTENQAISLTAGGKYFYEFGNKYSTQATLGDLINSYKIESNRLQRNSGLLTVKAQYENKNLAISASLNKPLEQKNNTYYLFNLGYKF